MKRFLFFSLALGLFVPILSSQILTDDFSDGNLLNPGWFGDLGDFTVESEELRLNADGAGSSEISLVAIAATDGTVTYELLARLEFAPSASNYAEVVISGNDGPTALAYRLRIGGISGDQDALVLTAERAGVSEETVLSGNSGAVGQDPALVRVRLSRTLEDQWTLETDYLGGTDFTSEASGMGPSPGAIDLNRFSIRCVYTSSRSSSMYFDDVRIAPVIIDTEAPEIISCRTLAADRLEVLFSEVVGDDPAGSPDNYLLSTGSPSVSNVDFLGNSVVLTFSNELPVNQNLELTIVELIDLSGNASGSLNKTFSVAPTDTPKPDNLIITEFMADPTPEVGLPNAEYVEIYNKSDVTIFLAGLAISSGGAPRSIPAGELAPGAFMTLTDEDAVSLFAPEQNALGVAGFPSLTNGGDEIELTFDGNFIQRLVYTDDWYDDPQRSEGGYSLELTDLTTNNPDCPGLWAASRSPIGGTPGMINSVTGLVTDREGPVLLGGVFVEGGIELRFSEALSGTLDPGAFSVSPNLNVTDVIDLGEDNRYLLTLSAAPMERTVYEVSVQNEIMDCVGNFASATATIQLGLAEEVVEGDVVVNEILFNPFTGGVDFVELFNCSEKVLNVEGWVLANEVAMTGSTRERIGEAKLFLPGGYLVITPDVNDILFNYADQARAEFMIENRLPSLPNDAGNVTLYDRLGTELDRFDYREELHSELLDDEDGVSLERINPKAPTQLDGNWFSAAERVGFATPTRENSQRRDGMPSPEGDNFFSLEEETVSPDGDGFQDALLINYLTPGPGWNARIQIFDANGRLVKILRRSELLAGEGAILWDATTDSGERARTGVYVILIERFNPDGSTAEEKLAAVVYNG